MEYMLRPFVNLWTWIERVGGYPGQVMAGCLAVIFVLGVLSWIGNKK